jgi:serine/threonine protein kinase
LCDSEAPLAKIYGNRWLVKKSLNEGGQSVFFIVEDRTGKLPGEYALKRLKWLKRKDRLARFRNEVAILQRMDDGNIIKLVDAQVQEDGSDHDSFLVMPVAEHGDLDSRLASYKDQLESVVQVALQIARGLKHAHDNKAVHRDVKPGNILFPTVGHDAWVSDFGLSFDLKAEEQHTPEGEVVGLRVFIAPGLTEHGQHDVPAVNHKLRDIVSVRFGLPLEEATGTFPSRVSVVDDRLKRERKDSPNTKYRSRSALLQERASKLVSGSGELTTRVEPAMIGCET